MNKEFIPYKEAFALKKLGFNEECFGYYEKQNKYLVIDYDNAPLTNEQKKRLGLYKMTNNNSSLPQWAVAAPSYQQAFRWFRNEKKLAGMVEIGTQEFSFRIFDITKDKTIDTNVLSFNGTYEEAELACLKKLIEIVKTR